MAIGILGLLVLVLAGLVMVGLLVGGVVLDRRHRRQDAASSTDRGNGP